MRMEEIMGFFSWKCSVCDKSIPYDYKHPIHLVLPNDQVISGFYDGYGQITGEDNIVRDIFIEVGTQLGIVKNNNRDMAFSHTYKYKEFSTIFDNWQDIALNQSLCFIKNLEDIAGKTFNELKELGIGKFTSNLDIIHNHIKIVADKYYTGQKYKDLRVSNRCEHQGFLYYDDFIGLVVDDYRR